jgi:UDP-N-acetylglucosamine acyltransferase
VIHPTAVVHPRAHIGQGVEVGPYAVIDEHVRIDDGTRIGPHAVITGHTEIGRNNHIFQFASLGTQPQDKKYAGEPTRLVIGDDNTIREFCTFNTGTIQDRGETSIGNDNWIMAYVHIAHDCVIGDHTILANNTSMAGHVEVGDYTIMGGFTLVHQFCKLGVHCFTSFASGISQDVPPYVTVAGHRAQPYGINSEGLRRRGFNTDAIAAIKRAYKILYRSGLGLDEAKQQLDELASEQAEVRIMLDFVANSQRGIIR